MTVLNIYALDDTEQQNLIACLPEGRHVIGRGGLLHVTDKRVSRNHAVINVSNDKITLTSVHINPCFFKALNGNNLTVISQNQESELNDGDQFALLHDAYWFRVKIKREEPQPNGKRLHDVDQQEIDAKKARLSTDLNETNENGQSTSKTEETIDVKVEGRTDPSLYLQTTPKTEVEQKQPSASDNNLTLEIKKENTTDINEQSTSTGIKKDPQMKTVETSLSDTLHDVKVEEETDSSIHFQETSRMEDLESDVADEVKQKPISSDDNLTKGINEEPKNEQSASTETKDIDPSLSGSTFLGQSGDNANNNPKRVRERCWYGQRCFRKNPNHRQTFSHPGDPDYEPDLDDDRPDCPFGAGCYRRNIDHRQEYKHTAPPAPRPTVSPPVPPNIPNPALTKKKPRKKANKSPIVDDSEEDYDYDDPFINDDSSDDFQPTDSNGSDSDWEDSQEVEESQDRNRMLNEAKKFTKNKRKKN